MSGRDLVDEMRSGARPLPDPSQRGRLFDFVLVAITAMAIGALAVVGYGAWSGNAPQLPSPAAMLATAIPAWGEADETSCQARGQAAAARPQNGHYMITNDSIATGVAFLTTKVACQLTLKPRRFCAADGKAQVVAIVTDYLNRMDAVRLGIAVQGAPMAVAGGLFGGEAAAGDGIYSDMAKDTLAYMAENNASVVAAIRALAQGGVIEADAFRSFPLGGLPSRIEAMFANVAPTGSLCA